MDGEWRTRYLTPVGEAIFDVGLLFSAWLISGVAFYYFCDEDWDPAYAFFFAVNVGLGVGYGKYMPTRDATKYFTSFFCMLGTSLAMGGLALLFEAITRRAKAASFSEPGHLSICCGTVKVRYDDLRLLLFGTGYAVMLGVGIWIGYEYEGYTDFADALLFAVTNYTTSGLLCPKYNGSSLISTTISLLIGIPFNGLFFGEIAARYFAHVMNRAEREAEEESAAGEAAALSGGGDGYGATAGEGGGAADGEADAPQRHKAITDDPYVDFLHQELVRSGLVARSHLEWLQSMYELQQTTGDTSTPEAQGGE